MTSINPPIYLLVLRPLRNYRSPVIISPLIDLKRISIRNNNIQKKLTGSIVDHIQHLAVVVSDIHDAIEWYKSRFDLQLSYSDESWALLEFSNISIALVLPNQHPPHIAIELDNPTSFGPLTHRRDGTASTYIKDPWGNSIEIMQTNRGDPQL